jgi:septal ring factor EnvC (AmiA/AmiB activator)
MNPNDPHNDPVVKSFAETVTDLGQVIEAEKAKRHRLQAELQSNLTEIDGAARSCDQWAAVLEKLLAAVSSRRDTLDARQDAARDALATTIAGEMGGTP